MATFIKWWVTQEQHCTLYTSVSPGDSTFPSPLLHPAFSTIPHHFPFIFYSTNMFFGGLPRIPWHSPMPTPNLLSCLTQIQRTARGNEGGGSGGGWVHPYTYCAVMVKYAVESEYERGVKKKTDLPHAWFKCNMSLMFGQGLLSVENLLRAWPCLKYQLLVSLMETVILANNCCKVMKKWWEAEQERDERKMGRGWERDER